MGKKEISFFSVIYTKKYLYMAITFLLLISQSCCYDFSKVHWKVHTLGYFCYNQEGANFGQDPPYFIFNKCDSLATAWYYGS